MRRVTAGRRSEKGRGGISGLAEQGQQIGIHRTLDGELVGAFPQDRAIGRADSTAARAAARRGASPTGTSGPKRPPARISAGPLGQSVLTTGQPHAIASTNTLPKPSHAEDKASTRARTYTRRDWITKSGQRDVLFDAQALGQGHEVGLP